MKLFELRVLYPGDNRTEALTAGDLYIDLKSAKRAAFKINDNPLDWATTVAPFTYYAEGDAGVVFSITKVAVKRIK